MAKRLASRRCLDNHLLLDPGRHSRDQFDSGKPILDEWLRRYAGQNRRRDTVATWVITTADDLVVAYTSVAMTGIDCSTAPAELIKGSPDQLFRESSRCGLSYFWYWRADRLVA